MKHKRQPESSTSTHQTSRYEPPRIVAYDESDLLDMIGPAVACARWPAGSVPRGDWSYEPGKYEDF